MHYRRLRFNNVGYWTLTEELKIYQCWQLGEPNTLKRPPGPTTTKKQTNNILTDETDTAGSLHSLELN